MKNPIYDPLFLQQLIANRWSSLFPAGFGRKGTFLVLTMPDQASWEDALFLRDRFQNWLRTTLTQPDPVYYPLHYLWTVESRYIGDELDPSQSPNLHFNYIVSAPVYPNVLADAWTSLLRKRFPDIRDPHALHHCKPLEDQNILPYIFKSAVPAQARFLQDRFHLPEPPRLWGLNQLLREKIYPLFHPPASSVTLLELQAAREQLMIESGLEQLDPTTVRDASYGYFQKIYLLCRDLFIREVQEYRATKKFKLWHKTLSKVVAQPLPTIGPKQEELWCLLTLLAFVASPYLQWDFVRSSRKLGNLLLARVFRVDPLLLERLKKTTDIVDLGQKIALCSREFLNDSQNLFRVSAQNNELKLDFTPAGAAVSAQFQQNQFRLGSALSRAPTVCPPKDWTASPDSTNAADNCSGGYLSNGESFRFPLVPPTDRPLNYQAASPVLSGSEFLSAINRLQQFPFSLNRPLYDYARTVFWSRCQTQWEELKGVHRSQREALFQVIRERKPLGDSAPYSNRYQALLTPLEETQEKIGYYEALERLWPQVDPFFDQDLPIYFPYRADFRGRLYALPDFFNPVSSKLARSLVQTASSYPWDANCLTIFKHSMHRAFSRERLSPEDHLRAFERELSPRFSQGEGRWRYETPFFWEQAREPEAFLAHCFEWERYLVWQRSGSSEPYQSHFLVFLDSSCSGLQHLSLFLDFPDLWGQLNLVPRSDSEPLGDAYLEVGTQFMAFLRNDHPEIWKQLPPALHSLNPSALRKLFKLPVMTLFYGATALTIADQFQVQLLKLKELSDPEKAAKYSYNGKEYPLGSVLAFLFRPFLAARYPQLNSFLEMAAQTGRYFASEDLPIPLSAAYCGGLLASQQYRLSKQTVLDHKPPSGKGKRITMTVSRRTPKPALVKSSQSLAANVVHFLDALLVRRLLLALPPDMEAFLSIHDCWGVPLHRVDWLREEVSRQLLAIYGGSDRPLVLTLLEEWLEALRETGEAQALEPFLEKFQSAPDRESRLEKLKKSRSAVSH